MKYFFPVTIVILAAAVASCTASPGTSSSDFAFSSAGISTNAILTNTNQTSTNTIVTNLGGTNITVTVTSNPQSIQLQISNFITGNTNWTLSNFTTPTEIILVSNRMATNSGLGYTLVSSTTNRATNSVYTSVTNFTLITGNASIATLPSLRPTLPDGLADDSLKLKLKLKLKAPRHRAPGDLTTFSSNSFEDVKSEGWKKLVDQLLKTNTLQFMFNSLKFYVLSNDFVTDTVLALSNVPMPYGENGELIASDLGSLIMRFKGPASNLLEIYWLVWGYYPMYMTLSNDSAGKRVLTLVDRFMDPYISNDYVNYALWRESDNTLIDFSMQVDPVNGVQYSSLNQSTVNSSGELTLYNRWANLNGTNDTIAWGDNEKGGIIYNYTSDWYDDIFTEYYNLGGNLVFKSYGDTGIGNNYDWMESYLTNGVNLTELGYTTPPGTLQKRGGWTNSDIEYVHEETTNEYDDSIPMTTNHVTDYYTNVYDEVDANDPSITNSITNVWTQDYDTYDDYTNVHIFFIVTNDMTNYNGITYEWFQLQLPGGGWSQVYEDTNWDLYNLYHKTIAGPLTNGDAVYWYDSVEYDELTWNYNATMILGSRVPTPRNYLGKNYYFNNTWPIKYLKLDANRTNFELKRLESSNSVYETNEYVDWDGTTYTNIYIWQDFSWWLDNKDNKIDKTNDIELRNVFDEDFWFWDEANWISVEQKAWVVNSPDSDPLYFDFMQRPLVDSVDSRISNAWIQMREQFNFSAFTNSIPLIPHISNFPGFEQMGAPKRASYRIQ